MPNTRRQFKAIAAMNAQHAQAIQSLKDQMDARDETLAMQRQYASSNEPPVLATLKFDHATDWLEEYQRWAKRAGSFADHPTDCMKQSVRNDLASFLECTPAALLSKDPQEVLKGVKTRIAPIDDSDFITQLKKL